MKPYRDIIYQYECRGEGSGPSLEEEKQTGNKEILSRVGSIPRSNLVYAVEFQTTSEIRDRPLYF